MRWHLSFGSRLIQILVGDSILYYAAEFLAPALNSLRRLIIEIELNIFQDLSSLPCMRSNLYAFSQEEKYRIRIVSLY